MPDVTPVWWNSLQPGHRVLDPEGLMWDVDDVQQGWTLLRRRDYASHGGARKVVQERQVPPMPPDTSVMLVTPTLEEAERLVAEALEGQVVHRARVEALAAWAARALRTRMPPTRTKGTGWQAQIRMHLALGHGLYVTGMSPKDMAERHVELHSTTPDEFGMAHHHG